MKQMIIETDEGVEFDDMEADLQAAICKVKITWPESIMIGTQPISGKQVVLIMCGVDGATLTDLMNNEEFDENGKQVKFNLGWSVLAEEGEPINQALLLPYFLDIPLFDENGDQIGSEPILDLEGRLQNWAGHRWTFE